MKRKKIVAMTLGLVLLGNMNFSLAVQAAEENVGMTAEEQAAMQWKIEANESLGEYGVSSPYYSTGQWNDPNAYTTAASYDWFNLNDYSVYCDPYYGVCLLKNVGSTSAVEATPSVGVVNEVQSKIGIDCMPDFSNMVQMRFSQEDIGITAEELSSIPLPQACTSWRHPLEYTDEMIDYSFYFHDLIWKHKGSYNDYSSGIFAGLSVRDKMQIRVINGQTDFPIGCHVNTYDDNYYGGAIRSIRVVYPYADQSCYFRTQQTFSITLHENDFSVPTDDHIHREDVWTIEFQMYPNEMDMQQIHGLLRLITPDADEIYNAIYQDFFGDDLYSPLTGYAPWKYYDKWYDIGTQTRIRSSYKTQTEKWAENLNSLTGFKPTSYIYDIAPRVGVSAPGYGIR